MGTSTVVLQFAQVFLKLVQPSHIPVIDKDICLKTERDFKEKWNFPNCFACIDGMHIRIKRPAKSGSPFYNYKQYFSITLEFCKVLWM